MAAKPNRALVATTAVAAAAGCFVTWKLYREWKLLQKEKEKSLPELAANICADDLAALTHSDNTALKRSAEQVLVDRMMSENNLEYLLNQCASSDEEDMKKAISVLSIVTKTNEYKPCLMEHNVLEVVIGSIKRISEGFQIKKLTQRCHVSNDSSQTLKNAVVTIYDLVTDSEENLSKLFDSSKVFVAFLLEIVSDPSHIISQDITRLCILILQQMMQNEHMRVNLLSYGMIQRITLCFLRTIGDTWLSRNCLQILVMYINFFEDYVTEEFLQEMAQLGIVPVLIGCLKFEDSDLVYWSTALIHEFLLKDLHRGIISTIPDIVNTFYHILVSSESGLQRLILRIFCFLSINDNKFKIKLSNFKPLLKRMSICLASGNNDLVYWALLLVHDLAMMGKDVAFKLVKANEELLRSVIALTENKSNGLVDAKLVAETLGFFCSCEKLAKTIVEAGCIKSVLMFLKSDNTDLQFWASSLLLNLSMSSDDARESIIKEGGIGLLLEMAVKESEMPQITAQASKILVMLGFSGAVLNITLKSGTDSSIQIDQKEYSRMKNGINMVTANFLDFKISKGRTYDPSSSLDVMRLVKTLGKHRQNELIMLTTQGCVNSYIKEQSTTALTSAFEAYGLATSNLEDGGAWCILAQADEDNVIHPLIVKQDGCNLIENTSVSLALQVNNYVRDDLLKPLLNIIMSIPAGSNISKVPELEILSTLARHQKHQKVMLSTVGFLDYLAELIWCFSCLDPDQLSTKPLMIAHCVGALKIVHSLSTNTELCDKLVQSPIIGAIKSFLFTNCSVFISEMKHLDDDVIQKVKHSSLFSPADDVFIIQENAVETARSRGHKTWSANSLDDVELPLQSAKEKEQFSDIAQPRSEQQDIQSRLQNNAIEALIAQVASEKTFGEEEEYLRTDIVNSNELNSCAGKDLANSGTKLDAAAESTNITQSVKLRPNFNVLPSQIENERDLRDGCRVRSSTASADCKSRPEERHESSSSGRSDSHVNRKRCQSADCNRVPRSSARSRSPAFHKRVDSEMGKANDDDDNDDFDFDEFEEEDLPNLPDNEEDNFAASQGRLFFDIPRMASVQRLRSASGFDPNDWPTTRPGSLSRALNDAAHRSKSPLKDIAADLEDFDEALLNLTNYALMTVYFCLKNKDATELYDDLDISKLLHILWCVMLSCRAGKKLEFGMIIAAIISKLTTVVNNETDSKGLEKQNSVCLDGENVTSSMIISNDLLEIYNGNWTFESAHATNCIGKNMMPDSAIRVLGWYYEVSLFSKGIMQIGWATHNHGFNYEPERGLGVGDCLKSVGFDGSRCKIWNGPIGEDDPDNKYGRNWKIGDTVSCLLSVNGDVSFWLNGQDLGIALTNLDANLLWYPAISLSLDQQCRANFGAENFMYEPPEAYHGIQETITSTRASDLDLSPPSSLTASGIHSDTSRYSRDGSSYSSYEVLDRSAERNFSFVEESHTPNRKRPLAANVSSKPNLGFSPRDLMDSRGDVDLCEVMYYEVKIPSKYNKFEIGFQSTVEQRRQVCLLHGNTITLPSSKADAANGAILYCDEVFGCGILWPVKKLFFTLDGIGTPFSVDLHDLGQIWPENLDEIVPYFSREKLQINFGQNPFSCQAMNSNSYRKQFCQHLYHSVLRSEENFEER